MIYTNEVFELIKDSGQTLAAVVADKTDHRQSLREAQSSEEKEAAVSKLAVKRLSGSCARNLDATFAAVFSA